MNDQQMAYCRGCGKLILWMKTAAGKNMPCNPEIKTYWAQKNGNATIITPNGETVKANLKGDLQNATGIGYEPHWGTCTARDKFKK